ncbi:uncharacterized protein LOC133907172 [Phragmites australis]|uniref:uncharacterized protein LOC133907172 n=1 Tax=Phragmites australis TaxID=29695 RepID=UPI002D770935|nr:uncharacterized protein LOC133907172 [Phragmites australis]
MDYAVLSLLYVSTAEEILTIVLMPSAFAHAVLTSLEELFRDNKIARAHSLEAEFHNFVQSDQTILTYSQHLKSFDDALADLRQPVFEDTLVLTMLRGLSEPFYNIATVIKTKASFPEFLDTHSLLFLEKADLKITEPGSCTALVVTTSTKQASNNSSGHSTGYSTGTKTTNIASSGGNNDKKNKGKNRRGGGV